MDAEIVLAEREIARQVLDSAAMRRLLTIPGVNAVTACAVMAAIGDIGRFPSPGRLVSYLGLDPRVAQGKQFGECGTSGRIGCSRGAQSPDPALDGAEAAHRLRSATGDVPKAAHYQRDDDIQVRRLEKLLVLLPAEPITKRGADERRAEVLLRDPRARLDEPRRGLGVAPLEGVREHLGPRAAQRLGHPGCRAAEAAGHVEGLAGAQRQVGLLDDARPAPLLSGDATPK
jgi:hypothetical protein